MTRRFYSLALPKHNSQTGGRTDCIGSKGEGREGSASQGWRRRQAAFAHSSAFFFLFPTPFISVPAPTRARASHLFLESNRRGVQWRRTERGGVRGNLARSIEREMLERSDERSQAGCTHACRSLYDQLTPTELGLVAFAHRGLRLRGRDVVQHLVGQRRPPRTARDPAHVGHRGRRGLPGGGGRRCLDAVVGADSRAGAGGAVAVGRPTGARVCGWIQEEREIILTRHPP